MPEIRTHTPTALLNDKKQGFTGQRCTYNDNPLVDARPRGFV
jgi:hypothetical protein